MQKNYNLPVELIEAIGLVRLVVFDFDGVFTNNKVIVSQNGEESVVCDRSDGIGISRLKDLGLESIILSTEKNPVVTRRAEKLKLVCYQGVDEKLEKLKEIARGNSISLKEIAFVGNDSNDSECLESVGLPITVNDAHDSVKELGRYITSATGGNGAVREVCDLFCDVVLRDTV